MVYRRYLLPWFSSLQNYIYVLQEIYFYMIIGFCVFHSVQSQVVFLIWLVLLTDILDQDGGRKPWHSINFICAHDGFTLADLVTYNNKSNLSNGEDNRDGENHNLSWNCGEVNLYEHFNSVSFVSFQQISFSCIAGSFDSWIPFFGFICVLHMTATPFWYEEWKFCTLDFKWIRRKVYSISNLINEDWEYNIVYTYLLPYLYGLPQISFQNINFPLCRRGSLQA